MVEPSEAWCKNNGYVITLDNQGTSEKLADVIKAVTSDAQLESAIATINNMMGKRGFDLVNLADEARSIQKKAAEEAVLLSKSGASLKENSLDQLRRTAKSDIILRLSWFIESVGPKRSINYNLQAIDAYSNKSIAGAGGTGTPSLGDNISLSRLLEEAAMQNIDEFASRLLQHFESLQEKGREISIDINVFDNDNDIDLEKVYGDKELIEHISDWFSSQCVNRSFTKKAGSTENKVTFNQVRIPLFDKDGNAIDAENFGRSLRRYLRAAPFNLEVKIIPNGLGNCMLIIG